jgi:hypothetical protein
MAQTTAGLIGKKKRCLRPEYIHIISLFYATGAFKIEELNLYPARGETLSENMAACALVHGKWI